MTGVQTCALPISAALAEKRAFNSLAAANKFKSAERVDSDEEDGSDVDGKPVDVDTETPPTSHSDDEIASDQSSDVEVPDSQPQQPADRKRPGEEFGFSFKPINKKRKEAMSLQADADSDGIEQLPSTVKRKKSSKKAKMKA